MNPFSYKENVLHIEDVSLSDIAEKFGTPCYVYSRSSLEKAYTSYEEALKSYPHLICYAVKANYNLAVLNLFARLGSGFDIVSGGELARVIAAGGDPQKIVFSGVGKTSGEIQEAILTGILCFNVESEAEMVRINKVATSLQTKAPISLRVNPDVDAQTHPYISTGLKKEKFGVPIDDAIEFYRMASSMPNLIVKGIDCHIGSQLMHSGPMQEASEKIAELLAKLSDIGIRISHVDLGGGLGVSYKDEKPPDISTWISNIVRPFKNTGKTIIVEPGRSLSGNAGILLTKVEYIKEGQESNFAIVDAGMNDLIRPALYEANHDIKPVLIKGGITKNFDVVGPVCESADIFIKNHALRAQENDLLAIMSAGAYGMTMSSNYNGRARPPEIMVDKSTSFLVKKREQVKNLFNDEMLLP